MQKLTLIPTLISSLRILALPLFVYLYNFGNVIACLVLLAFCVATDFFDGYLARKFRATSKFGAYYDASTDFISIIGIFVLFYTDGYYPIWLLFLIGVAFTQFLVTSVFAQKLYDPVGKYLGSALYIGIVLTLLWPTGVVFAFVQYAFVGFLVVSLASRLMSLMKKDDTPKLK